MKKLLSITLVLAIALTLVVPSYSFATGVTMEKVLILFHGKVDRSVITEVNGVLDKEYENIAAVSANIPTAAKILLERNPAIAAVEEDQVVQGSMQNQGWGYKRVNAPAAKSSSFTGKGIKVAVLDSGISEHEDLVIAGGVSFVSYTESYHDDEGHGTHVAGIIGAKDNDIGTVGVAPDASLYAVKVSDQEGNAYVSDIIAGIDWSITNKMDIINLSLGSPDDSVTFKMTIDKAYNNGILVVAAAGNDGNADGSGDTVAYPARYGSAIAVSAIDSKDNRAEFSATGQTVEIAAPGVRVLSTYLNNEYAYMSGTSMAAPFVAGVLALLKESNPGASHTKLREMLKQSAEDIGEPGKDVYYGYGVVQAPYVEEEPTPPPVVEPIDPPIEEEEPIKQGWVQEDGIWYYYDEFGMKEKGWLKDQNKWYFLSMEDGAMQTGWLYEGEKWYYLKASGAMQTGWLYEGNKWYFLAGSGAMQTGWLYDGGYWYYLNSSGAMAVGWKKVNTKWYYLYSNGKMAKNTTIDGYRVGNDGAWIQ
ncbi:S8 family serine peptidase [Bacillus timonensis]|nr:S8 family serine peptidase [Bacillus timonensis]